MTSLKWDVLSNPASENSPNLCLMLSELTSENSPLAMACTASRVWIVYYNQYSSSTSLKWDDVEWSYTSEKNPYIVGRVWMVYYIVCSHYTLDPLMRYKLEV